MKNKITSTCLTLFFTLNIHFTVFALGNTDSTNKQSKIHVGFSAGPNFTHVVKNYYLDEPKPVLKYSAGLFFQYDFSKLSALRLEVDYSRKGVKSGGGFIDVVGNNTTYQPIYYDRLSLPLYYRLTSGKFFIDVGIFAGYALRNIYIYNYNNGSPSEKYVERWIKPFYKGISGGFGFNFLSKKSFLLSAELRDNLELTNEKSFNGYNWYRLNTIDLLFSFAFKL